MWSGGAAGTRHDGALILPRSDRQLQQDHGIGVAQRLVLPQDAGRQRIPRIPQRVCRRAASRRQQEQREAQTPRSRPPPFAFLPIDIVIN